MHESVNPSPDHAETAAPCCGPTRSAPTAEAAPAESSPCCGTGEDAEAAGACCDPQAKREAVASCC